MQDQTIPKVLNIFAKAEVDSYPYGRLRCKAFFWIEYKQSHGFRPVFQTINPKTGRLNAVKNGQYASSGIFYLTQNQEGFVDVKLIDFNQSLVKTPDSIRRFVDVVDQLALDQNMINHCNYYINFSMKANYKFDSDIPKNEYTKNWLVGTIVEIDLCFRESDWGRLRYIADKIEEKSKEWETT
jgi:hypothetical protein